MTEQQLLSLGAHRLVAGERYLTTPEILALGLKEYPGSLPVAGNGWIYYDTLTESAEHRRERMVKAS